MGFKQDLSQSVKDFDREVRPKLEDFFDAEIMPIEGTTIEEIEEDLDQQAGIDAWVIDHGTGMRGLASRVQWPGNSFSTFTIRKNRYSGTKTEYEKRLHAIENGWLYPYWTCQAYFDETGGKLLEFGVIKTKKLIEYIAENSDGGVGVRNTVNADFYFVEWDKLDMTKRWSKND